MLLEPPLFAQEFAGGARFSFGEKEKKIIKNIKKKIKKNLKILSACSLGKHEANLTERLGKTRRQIKKK